MQNPHIPSLIEKKRDGHELTPEEIDFLVSGFTHGEIPDYQISAWLMATFFRGMTPAETQALTASMMESGTIFDYPKDSPPKVDKHSTGGVGDKVSLILAPLLACDNLWVPMISGRGLGITGGTLDKLESIPRFNVDLDEHRALLQLNQQQRQPRGDLTPEYLARLRMKERVEEQRAITAARDAKRDAYFGKAAKCVKGAAAPGCCSSERSRCPATPSSRRRRRLFSSPIVIRRASSTERVSHTFDPTTA